MTRIGVRKWTPTEELLLEPALLPLDKSKNPQALRCLFCSRLFRFEDQVLAHLWAKHRKQFIAEVVLLRRELGEAKAAITVFRGLSKETSQPAPGANAVLSHMIDRSEEGVSFLDSFLEAAMGGGR